MSNGSSGSFDGFAFSIVAVGQMSWIITEIKSDEEIINGHYNAELPTFGA